MSSFAQQEQSRKRAAPGGWPQNPPQSLQTHAGSGYPEVGDASQLSDDQFLSWGANNAIPGPTENQRRPQAQGTGPSGHNTARQSNQTSNQLVRRLYNTQIAEQADHDAQLQRLDNNRGSPAVVEDSDGDEGDLDARAQEAKRDAASKRPPRQIPPFIQKLSKFLDDPANQDLIRWADDGKSFIVLDEDRFANELIPEMFKHNNYASFVRQLNMYGFHKKVGLSDNSMRASEKKAKLPSGYRHKYFRQGRPDLLWLIEKPRPGNLTAKKKPLKTERNDGGSMSPDPEDERSAVPTSAKKSELVSVPKSDLNNYRNLQREVQDLQKSQQHIYGILKGMRDENKQYIRQATSMLANHERHESSINAILQFLATFYNQSLAGGNANADMFSNSMPHQQQSSVVEDMGDYTDPSTEYGLASQQFLRQRKPLAILPPPASESQPNPTQRNSPFVKSESAPVNSSPNKLQIPGSENRASSVRSSARPSASPEPEQRQTPQQPSPRDDHDNSDILNVINRSNAQQTTQPNYDLSAIQQYSQNANGNNGPLTPEQRNMMLSLMKSNSGSTTPALSTANQGPNPVDLNLNQFEDHQAQLELLANLQKQQDSKVQDLAGRLQPLSPHGSIPGLDVVSTAQQQPQQDGFDLNEDQWDTGQFNPQSDGFNFDSYLNDDLFDGAAVDSGYDQNPEFGIDWNNVGQDGINFDDANLEEATASQDPNYDGTGRIMGSVGTSSSGAPTPAPGSVQGEADNEASHVGKKRRLDG